MGDKFEWVMALRQGMQAIVELAEAKTMRGATAVAVDDDLSVPLS